MMIPEKKFSAIHALVPLVCVDLVTCERGRVLIVKRSIEPMRGEWYFPGGRVMRNESISDAGKRIAYGETGLEIGPMRFLDYTENFFMEDPFGHGKGTHTISLVFAASIKEGGLLRCDRNHSEAHFAKATELTGMLRALADMALEKETVS